MNRPHALPLLIAAAALTAGCGGPDRPLKVGFKEVPSNVVLGAQSSPTPEAPAGPPSGGVTVVHLPPPPSVVALPPPPFQVPERDRPAASPLPPPPPVCGVADPLEPPAREAPTTIAGPPADAAYLFRNDGTFEVSGADARRGRFPEVSLRTVETTFASDDGQVFDFTVTETLGETTTTTGYRVLKETALIPAVEGGVEPGLYITSVETTHTSGRSSDFSPTPHLQVAALPLVRGGTVEARGVDPQTATTMSFTSTVTGKARVDACGTPLDSWTIELAGEVLGPSEDVDFESTYFLGTQFGGILLRDTVAFAGQVDGVGVSRSITSTISRPPTPVSGPQP